MGVSGVSRLRVTFVIGLNKTFLFQFTCASDEVVAVPSVVELARHKNTVVFS